jgi:hypothetical protein
VATRLDQLGQADEVVGRDRQREHPPDAGKLWRVRPRLGVHRRKRANIRKLGDGAARFFEPDVPEPRDRKPLPAMARSELSCSRSRIIAY